MNRNLERCYLFWLGMDHTRGGLEIAGTLEIEVMNRMSQMLLSMIYLFQACLGCQ